MRRRGALLLTMLCLAVVPLLAGCGVGTGGVEPPALAPGATPRPRPAGFFLTPPPSTPGPVVFPRDDGPHADLTEWWYYTGHLVAGDGGRYGFEFVVFQIERGDRPPTYAAHFAVTDLATRSFHYEERTQAAGQPASAPGTAILVVGGWTLLETGGSAHIRASMAGYALDLTLDPTKPPALHNGGYFEYAPGSGSYYYSRTRQDVHGTLTVAGQLTAVTGVAWMDHQWGNFLVAGAGQGGWDWFSIQLSDDRELMLWHTRDAAGRVVYGLGTLVAADGSTRTLRASEFTVAATGSWTSPHSGTTYPSGWIVTVPGQQLRLTLTLVIPDQELSTPRSTGVTYWEGDVDVSGQSAGQSITGQSYVELTGYAPPPGPP